MGLLNLSGIANTKTSLEFRTQGILTEKQHLLKIKSQQSVEKDMPSNFQFHLQDAELVNGGC